jgi:VWFA-related protein
MAIEFGRRWNGHDLGRLARTVSLKEVALQRPNFNLFFPVFASCFIVSLFAQTGAPTEPATQSSASQDPALLHRPTAVPVTDGRVKLEVVVTNKQGGPVPGLDLKDFTLLDNKKSQAILGFKAEEGSRQTQVPTEVILVLDTVNSTFQQAAFARQQTAKFLTRNGGQLAYPTSIALFSTDGVHIQPQPSTDGSALAALIEQASANLPAVDSTTGDYGEVGRFQLSVRTLTGIAENEAKKPGRKMLIWIGPGWPTLAGTNFGSTTQDRQRLFAVIVELSTRLREAHMKLYSISPLDTEKRGAVLNMPPTGSAGVPTLPMPASESAGAQRTIGGGGGNAGEPNYKEFLKGTKSAKQADSESLAFQVLAVQSGGRVLNPNNDLSGQLADCLEELNAFYTISFDPPRAEQTDEYHELKVLVSRAGLTVRTNSGYYNQP